MPTLVLVDPAAHETEWNDRYSAIFAHALKEKFGLPVWATIVRGMDGSAALIHAFCRLPDGRVVDARGVCTQKNFDARYRKWQPSDWAAPLGRRPNEVQIKTAETPLAKLGEITKLDITDTAAAHAFIETHPERFAACARVAAKIAKLKAETMLDESIAAAKKIVGRRTARG